VERSGFDPVRGVMAGQRAWVTHGSRIWADPDPSPDGRRVVFYSLVDPEGHLYVTNADGSGPLREVTGDSAVDRLPRWSPDGKWIATFSDRSGPLQIWKIRPDGSGLTRLTDVSGNVAYGVWSPDARRMVARVLHGHDWSTFLLDPNRSWAEQRITPIAKPPDSLEEFAPHSWSPDGARLAGLFNGLDKGIIVFTFATGRYERLTDFGQWPVWLPDSRRILFVSGGHAFYVIDRVTNSVHKVFTSGRDVVGPPELTPDGRTVFYTHRVTEADIWVVTMH
jgi:Tol biopolymer transport system component